MLQRKMYSQKTEEDESKEDGNVTMEVSLGEPGEDQDTSPTANASAMDSIVGSIANLLGADKKDQKAKSDLVEGVYEPQHGALVDETEIPVVNTCKEAGPVRSNEAESSRLTELLKGSRSETNPWDEAATVGTLIVSILHARGEILSKPEDDEPQTEVVICEVTFGYQKIRLEPHQPDETASLWQPHRLVGEVSISVHGYSKQVYMMNLPLNLPLDMKQKHLTYEINISVRGQTDDGESVGPPIASSSPSESGTAHSLEAFEDYLDDDFEADDEASYRAYGKTSRDGELGKKKRASGIYVNGQRGPDSSHRERRPLRRERRKIVDQPPVTRVPYNKPEWGINPFDAETDPQRRPVFVEEQPPSDSGLVLEGVELCNRQGPSSSEGSQEDGEAHVTREELRDETQETREDEKRQREEHSERRRLRIAEANAEIASAPVRPASRRSAIEVDDHQAELVQELRRLDPEEERRREKARRLAQREKKAEEAQRQRLRKRM
ncbi:hypothetical protein NW762_008349 [Fusarium torreyae]|uniref:Uncharacterized protein n=1 Tax=Fusarium torreyae TaxID=1237075 RepID=A0A9W8S011_9HYPO|nr:hypothetical protein NW762_008349 [Fusarium torreyae]